MRFLLFLFLVMPCLSFSSGEEKAEKRLKCYQCNSFYNSSCEPLNKAMYLEECLGENQNFCRIMEIDVERNKTSFKRVVRSCGKTRHHNDCYRTASLDTKTRTCQCFHDGCNQAPTIIPTMLNFLVLIWICAVFFR